MKRLYILVLILLILTAFYPKIALAQSNIIERAWGFFSEGWKWLTGTISAPVVNWAQEKLAQFAVWLIELTARVFFIIISILNNIVAIIVDYFASLNPFAKTKEGFSPTEALWQILKTFSYIILTFSALFAGFEWLRGNDVTAKRLIFHIIVVALLINFSFFLVKEAFNIAWNLEKGLSGGVSAGEQSKIGTLIAASLWQTDPFKEVNSFFVQGIGDTEGLGPTLARGFSYFFLVAFAIINFIVLVMVLAIYLARYIIFILLGGVSPLALASLTFPEPKGPASQVFASIRFFNKWLEYLVSWMIVIPVFVIMVILGVLIQKNTLENAVPNNLAQFILNLFFLLAWYLISMRIAIRLSGAVGKFAQSAAVGALLGLGTLGAGALWFRSQGLVGGALKNVGTRIAESRLPTFVRERGLKLKEIGGEMVKTRWARESRLEKAILEERIERLNRETDEGKKAQLRNEIAQRVQRYSKNPEVLKTIAPSLKGMTDQDLFAFLRESPEFVGVNMPMELRNVFIKRTEEVSKKALRDSLSNESFVNKLNQMSGDFLEVLNKKIADELKPEDVVQILGNENIRKTLADRLRSQKPEIKQVYEKLQNAYNQVSYNLAQAMIEENADEIKKIAGTLPSIIKNLPRLENQFQNLKINQEDLISEALNSINEEMSDSLFSIRKKLTNDSLRLINNFLQREKQNLSPETIENLWRIIAGRPESRIIIASS